MIGQLSGNLSSKVEISVVEKTSNKEMSDALFPGRIIVQDLCYKSIKALDSYSLRVKNSRTVQHAVFSRRKFIGYNTI